MRETIPGIRDLITPPIRTEPEPGPFLRLPLEIRQQIYSYLLPRTVNLRLPKREHGREIAWRRGNISILSLNHQIYTEAASMIYGGTNYFVLEVDYDGTRFQFQRLMASGLIPKQTPRFLDKIATRNMKYLKNVIVNVNHVDSYTADAESFLKGMIKYNCGGRGLTNGIKLQVQKLVDVLKMAEELTHLEVHLIDHKIDVKSSQQALEPFAELDNVHDQITVTGTETPDFLENLRRARRESTFKERHGDCTDGHRPRPNRLLPDLALANFYEDTHVTPKELQGF